jgi:hypothetical protein
MSVRIVPVGIAPVGGPKLDTSGAVMSNNGSSIASPKPLSLAPRRTSAASTRSPSSNSGFAMLPSRPVKSTSTVCAPAAGTAAVASTKRRSPEACVERSSP